MGDFLSVTGRKGKTLYRKGGTSLQAHMFVVPLVVSRFSCSHYCNYLHFNFVHLDYPNLTDSSLEITDSSLEITCGH